MERIKTFNIGDRVLYTTPGGRAFNAVVVAVHQRDAFPQQAEVEYWGYGRKNREHVWSRDLTLRPEPTTAWGEQV